MPSISWLKLQKQPAIADDFVPGLQTGKNLRFSALAFAHGYPAPRELVFARLQKHVGHIFGIAQQGRVRGHQRVAGRAGADQRGHVHIFL